MFDQVQELESRLSEVVAGIDPHVVDAAGAVRLVDAFGRMERLAGAAKTLMVRRIADTKAWKADGDRSAAHWMARRSGTTVGQAVAELETVERLAECPRTEDALRAGDLSLAQASEITAAAVVDPGSEGRHLDDAGRLSLQELRSDCARTKAAVVDLEARRARIHRGRRLRTYLDAEGGWNLSVRDNPERGAEIMAALGPIRDELFATARKEDRREPSEAYAADALVELARRGGAGTASQRSSAKVIARIDAAPLLTGRVADGEVCEIAGVGPVAVSAVRELLDRGGFLAAVITKGKKIAGVAHLGRVPTAHQRSALEWLNPTCAAEGCGESARLEIDHADDWAGSKRTVFESLDRLCPHHHDRKTRDNWALVEGRGTRPFVPPDDRRHPRRARRRARPAGA